MSDSDPPPPTDPKDGDGWLESKGLSARALEELEERLVKKILNRISQVDPREGTSKGTEERGK